ncbi:MAG: DNA mismatch repair endonuclease MutL, partial [candidate division Zixibacteria bacterium]|nr:DNA mismatch repair endonuclease MutL [candidate division Zixibacteria bacterium]
MRNIAVLPEILINKIAAGEVVERPSSVVKELVENSLDAGATRVKVEIEKGGSKLIKITDNGEGIAKDFLPIALQRHATSKLQSLEELDSITSLGFRGEALPSIASVSLFEITSKTKEQLSGYKIRIEGGKIVEESDTGAPDGTVIEVRELFFNTPARRKFLKTQVTETRHIIDALNGLALAYPHSGFELVSEGRQLFDYNIADDYKSRVRDVLGGDFDKMVAFSEEGDRISLSGFTIKPEFALKNRAQIYFIVNGRRISSPLLYSALMKAYGEFLIKGRYPQAVIYIFMDPSALDINVSPTKSEVRFSDERAVFGALMSAARKCLTGHDVIPSGFGSARQTSSQGQEQESSDYRERIKAAAERFFTEGKAKPDINQRSFDIKTSPSPASLENIRPVPERKTDQPQEKEAPEVETGQRVETKAVKVGESVFELAPYRVEQFANLFIIAFSRDQITIIDQHAAHERILYERALKSFDRQKMSSQKMLMPVNIEMEPGMISGAEEYFELLNNLGFELERFGPRSLAIYAVPAVATGKNPETLVRDLLSDLM